MLYVVIAKDGTDQEAPARRAAVRAAHLEVATKLKAEGRLVTGGAILDDAQTMIGSMLILEAANEEEARRVIEDDIYTQSGVWQEYEIWPYRKAM